MKHLHRLFKLGLIALSCFLISFAMIAPAQAILIYQGESCIGLCQNCSDNSGFAGQWRFSNDTSKAVRCDDLPVNINTNKTRDIFTGDPCVNRDWDSALGRYVPQQGNISLGGTNNQRCVS